MGGGNTDSEIPLLSSFLYLFGEAVSGLVCRVFSVKSSGLVHSTNCPEDSVRRGV